MSCVSVCSAEATQAKKPSLPPPPVVPREGKGTRRGGKGKMELPPPAPVYEDPNDIRVPHINGTSRGVVPVNLYDTPADPQQPSGSHTRTPRFDDTIYAVRRDMGLEGEEETDGAVGDMGKPLPFGVISGIVHCQPSLTDSKEWCI